MIKLDNKEIEIELHTSVAEVSLSDYCDFINLEEKFIRSEDEDIEVAMVEMINILVPNANELPFSTGVEGIYNSLSLENVYVYYIDLFNNYFQKHIDGCISQILNKDAEDRNEFDEEILKLHKANLSIFDKCLLAVKITEHYNSDFKVDENTLSFVHDGDTFYLSGKNFKDYITGNGFTAGEVTVVKEFRRRLIENAEINDIYETGTMQFRLRLHDLAVLCRLENEKLPYDVTKRNDLISKRMKRFQDIPMDIAYNLVFFLTYQFQSLVEEAIFQDTLTATKRSLQANRV